MVGLGWRITLKIATPEARLPHDSPVKIFKKIDKNKN